MGIDNPVHLLFLGAIALVVLGPRRLPELAKALGKGMREFREAMSDGGEAGLDKPHASEDASAQPALPPPAQSAVSPTASSAQSAAASSAQSAAASSAQSPAPPAAGQ